MGRRSITLSAETIAALMRHKASQAKSILAAGEGYRRSDYIFATQKDTRCDMSNLRKW